MDELQDQKLSIYNVPGTAMTEGSMKCEESEGRLIIQVYANPPIDTINYKPVFLSQEGYDQLEKLKTPVNNSNFQLSDPRFGAQR